MLTDNVIYKHLSCYVRFQVLMAASMKFSVFWDVVQCNHFEVDRRFRGSYCLYQHRPDDGGNTNDWNVGQLQRYCTSLHPKRQNIIILVSFEYVCYLSDPEMKHFLSSVLISYEMFE
jgi:hypothetical protein